jgi:hypothetical protein
VWKSQEKLRQSTAPKKNIPKTTFSCRGAMKYILNLSIVKIPKKRNSTKPSRWVQILPVSVWMLQKILKQARKEGIGGLWPV